MIVPFHVAHSVFSFVYHFYHVIETKTDADFLGYIGDFYYCSFHIRIVCPLQIY